MTPGALGQTPGTVRGILRVGFEVRVTVTTEGGAGRAGHHDPHAWPARSGSRRARRSGSPRAQGATTVPVMQAV